MRLFKNRKEDGDSTPSLAPIPAFYPDYSGGKFSEEIITSIECLLIVTKSEKCKRVSPWAL